MRRQQHVVVLDVHIFQPMLLLQVLVKFDQLAGQSVQLLAQKLLVTHLLWVDDTAACTWPQVIVLILTVDNCRYPGKLPDKVRCHRLVNAMIKLGVERGRRCKLHGLDSWLHDVVDLFVVPKEAPNF